MSVSYASLADLREETNSTKTEQDTILLRAGRFMSEAVDEYVSSRVRPTTFAPRRVTRYFDAGRRSGSIFDYGKRLELAIPFVALSSVVDGDANALVADTDYYLMPRSVTPYLSLYRFDDLLWHSYSGDTPVAQIAVTGDWCYRQYYNEAWVDTTTLGAALADATGTALTVASGTNLSPGMMIRIDDEWLSIESGSGTSWTVNRGIRGSTAAAHLNGAALYRFVPEPVITKALMRWASLVFTRRGSFEQTSFDGTATVQFPTSMPDEVRDLLNHGGWMFRRGALA